MEKKQETQPKYESKENEEKLVLGSEDISLKKVTNVQSESEKILTPLGKGGRIIRGPFSSF